MKRLFVIFLAILICMAQFPVCAADEIVLPVALCCGEDAYSLELVYAVSSGAGNVSVELAVDHCLYDWNYLSQEGKLYIAVASAAVLPKDRTIVNIHAGAGAVLTLESVCVNGNVTENVYTSHTEEVDKAQDATCTTTGLTEGSHCSVCNEVLVAQGVIDALGHTPGNAVEENRVEPTCTTEGSYESVVYCTVCCAELSRETKILNMLGQGVIITGQVSFEGNSATTTIVKLVQNGTLIAQTEITGNMYSFSGVFTGIYDLVIERENHLPYTIAGVPVETADVDLTKHPVNAIANTVLVAGDINSDGCIDLQDVVLLTSSNTYSRSYDEAVNKSADVNGDRHFDLQDLAIITSEKNYGKEAITVSFGEIAD